MGKLNTNITHGNLNVRIRHGGGPGLDGIVQLAVIAGAAVGAALVIVEFAWLIITVGVAAAAVRLWLLYRRNLAAAAIAARGELIRAEQQARAAVRLAERRAHEIAVAEAGRPVIQNVIDHAALTAVIAAAVAGAQPQPARVIRGEVERLWADGSPTTARAPRSSAPLTAWRYSTCTLTDCTSSARASVRRRPATWTSTTGCASWRSRCTQSSAGGTSSAWMQSKN